MNEARAHTSLLSSCVCFLLAKLFAIIVIILTVAYHRSNCVRFTLNKAFRNDNNVIYDAFSFLSWFATVNLAVFPLQP